jgi:hypothetical protein
VLLYDVLHLRVSRLLRPLNAQAHFFALYVVAAVLAGDSLVMAMLVPVEDPITRKCLEVDPREDKSARVSSCDPSDCLHLLLR